MKLIKEITVLLLKPIVAEDTMKMRLSPETVKNPFRGASNKEIMKNVIDQANSQPGQDKLPLKINAADSSSQSSSNSQESSEAEESEDQIDSSTKSATQQRLRKRNGKTVQDLKNKAPTNSVKKKV
jgi:hypothetical protein